MEKFHLFKLQSTYNSKPLDTYLHMHHESLAVNYDLECTILCPTCSKWYKEAKKSSQCKPAENSIASGLDFGNAVRLGLDTPTMMEYPVLSRYRIYHHDVRIHKTYVFKWKGNLTEIVNPASPTLMTDIEEHNAFSGSTLYREHLVSSQRQSMESLYLLMELQLQWIPSLSHPSRNMT
jgi:hypothetical protein